MRLTKFDVLAKPADYADRAAQLALSRWKWDMLDLIDGVRSLNAVSTVSQLDCDLVAEFGEECVNGELLELVTVTYGEFTGVPMPAAAPPKAEPVPVPVPVPVTVAAPAPMQSLPVLEPSPALTLLPPAAAGPAAKAASLQERVAALKARALSAIQEAAVPNPPAAPAAPPPRPPAPSPDEVEFSLSSSPKPGPAQSDDAIEFSL